MQFFSFIWTDSVLNTYSMSSCFVIWLDNYVISRFKTKTESIRHLTAWTEPWRPGPWWFVINTCTVTTLNVCVRGLEMSGGNANLYHILSVLWGVRCSLQRDYYQIHKNCRNPSVRCGKRLTWHLKTQWQQEIKITNIYSWQQVRLNGGQMETFSSISCSPRFFSWKKIQ